jgi:1,4-alpha-glucan branching enzyme
MSHQVKKNLGAILHSGEAEFRVWAPFAHKVSLTGTFTPDAPLEMESEQDGYWSLTVKDVEIGQQYRYFIETADGILEKNDPRARAITSSDNGFSVIVDNEFDWGDTIFTPAPHHQQVIYELHVGTFNRPDPATPGTFDTAIERLDYLKELGITTIELMPVTSMAYSTGWGYAPNYIFSVESMLGGRHGLMSFVRACHERGIGVILDVVYNHFFGDTDLWQYDGWSENGRGGIYFYNDERGDTPWGGRPDYGRPEVRQFILDNVTMWLKEYRLDGLRIDSTIYMRNTEGRDNDPDHDIADAWYLLGDITSLAHTLNPEALIIAEDCAASEFITKPVNESGAGFDAQWELGFPHALRDALGVNEATAPNLAGVRYELLRYYNGKPYQMVVFSDSHDTAANGSVRLNEAVTPDHADSLPARQKGLLAASLTLTTPGIPMLLQGSEFMQGGAFNDWQELSWDRADTYAGIVMAHHHLIDLRLNKHGNTRGLSGPFTTIFHQDDTNFVIGYQRWDQGGLKDDVLIIVNFSHATLHNYSLTIPVSGNWTIRFNSSWKGYAADFPEITYDIICVNDTGLATLTLPPFGVLIASQE